MSKGGLDDEGESEAPMRTIHEVEVRHSRCVVLHPQLCLSYLVLQPAPVPELKTLAIEYVPACCVPLALLCSAVWCADSLPASPGSAKEPIEFCGTIMSAVGKQLVVEGAPGSRALEIGSLLCLEDRTPIGLVNLWHIPPAPD